MNEPNRNTQKGRLLELLRERGAGGVAIYEIFTPRPHGLGIAQYGARVLELRREGYTIENKDNKFYLYEGTTQQQLL